MHGLPEKKKQFEDSLERHDWFSLIASMLGASFRHPAFRCEVAIIFLTILISQCERYLRTAWVYKDEEMAGVR